MITSALEAAALLDLEGRRLLSGRPPVGWANSWRFFGRASQIRNPASGERWTIKGYTAESLSSNSSMRRSALQYTSRASRHFGFEINAFAQCRRVEVLVRQIMSSKSILTVVLHLVLACFSATASSASAAG